MEEEREIQENLREILRKIEETIEKAERLSTLLKKDAATEKTL